MSKQFGEIVNNLPRFGTIFTGIATAIIAVMFDLDILTECISLGTLLAFTTVCCGVIILRYATPKPGENDGRSSIHEAFLDHTQYAQSIRRSDYNSSLQYYAALCNQSVVFWTLLFLAHCFYFSFSLSTPTPNAIRVILGLLCLPSLIRIWHLPVDTANLPPADQFTCPFVPFLPGLGIFVNTYLIASRELVGYFSIGIWTLIGFSLYLTYGTLTQKFRSNFCANPDFTQRILLFVFTILFVQ